MLVETDLSGKHTLAFDSGERINLTKDESKEFEMWFEKKYNDRLKYEEY